MDEWKLEGTCYYISKAAQAITQEIWQFMNIFEENITGIAAKREKNNNWVDRCYFSSIFNHLKIKFGFRLFINEIVPNEKQKKKICMTLYVTLLQWE